MATTEMIKAVPHEFHETPCHGGKGAWYFKDMIANASEKKIIQYIHDDILPAGSSFGIHEHGNTIKDGIIEEWYICLSGNGVMILDGHEFPFGEGDVNVCRNGGSHGIYNNSDKDMRFLVIKAKCSAL